MKVILGALFDRKTGKAIPWSWFGRGEPPALVDQAPDEPIDGEPPAPEPEKPKPS